MMRRLPTILGGVLIAATAVSGCDKLVLGDQPDNTHEDIFETIWTDIDQNYSYFPIKEVDWDSVYAAFKPRIERTSTQDELFLELSDMLDHLTDSHVNLYISKDRYYSYLFSSSYPEYPDNYYPAIIEDNYLESLQGFFPYRYGFLEGENFGYLQIISFGGSESSNRLIFDIMEYFNSADGLIIDLRDNGGGFDSNSQFIAGLFTDRDIPYAMVRWKNGPGHNDFTGWETKTISPSGQTPYQKPVVLLTNRGCFSSTEDFVLAMRQLPQVTVVGDTTGGGSGNPIHRELPNGWTYRFSRWQIVTLQKTYYEGTGLPPDDTVCITPTDSAAGRDTILERAVDYLKNRQ